VRSLIERLHGAINRHDLAAFLDCFDDAYESEQPLYPERSFRGREGVRRNSSANLARVPDLRWDLVGACFSTDAAWCEWRWHGARLDGGRFDVQGVVIYGIQGGRTQVRTRNVIEVVGLFEVFRAHNRLPLSPLRKRAKRAIRVMQCRLRCRPRWRNDADLQGVLNPPGATQTVGDLRIPHEH
jgi:hypothetical protein